MFRGSNFDFFFFLGGGGRGVRKINTFCVGWLGSMMKMWIFWGDGVAKLDYFWSHF